MKYGNSNYLEMPREIINDYFFNGRLSKNGLIVYVVLKELEHKYVGSTGSYTYDEIFRRTDEQMAEHCKMSIGTYKKAKQELKKIKLIETFQKRFKCKNGKCSKKHITHYVIPEIL